MFNIFEIVVSLAVLAIVAAIGMGPLRYYQARSELRTTALEIKEAIKLTEMTSELQNEPLSLVFSPKGIAFSNQVIPLPLEKKLTVKKLPKQKEEFELHFTGTNWASPAKLLLEHRYNLSCTLTMNRLGRIRDDCEG